MKVMKRIIPIVILVMILQIYLATNVSHAETEGDVFSGVDISENGDGSIIAKLSTDKSTLTISGTGEMTNSFHTTCPWNNYKKT